MICLSRIINSNYSLQSFLVPCDNAVSRSSALLITVTWKL
uniref:Uncharacterized protein n=1 Tax=Arundo donax TaxID=35708 RepID=A0A0A9GXE4_ARUDO